MRRSLFSAAGALAAIATAIIAPSSCAGVDDATVGAGGAGGGVGGAGGVMIPPGEICEAPQPAQVVVRVQPANIMVPPCTTGTCVHRHVDVVVDPDVCSSRAVTFESSNADVAPAPMTSSIDFHRAKIPLDIAGGKTAGTATITVHVPRGDGTDATATLTVDVIDPSAVACSGAASTPLLKGGDTLAGTTGLTGAAIGLPAGADKPNTGSFLWSVTPFPATLACGADSQLPGYVALGPAITFGPEALVFNREVPLSVPINPALLPEKARWRHLRLAYSGPAFKKTRTVPVADPRVEKVNGVWAVTFKVPRLGTYQAVVKVDAGTETVKRRLTHRGVIGVSMGGAGTQTFGFRHHDLFDVIAPLGGFQDWAWLINYAYEDRVGGFRKIAPGTQLQDIQLTATPCALPADCKADERCLFADQGKGRCVLMPPAKEPYEHPSTFNTWWYEYPRTGTGSGFTRSDIIQLLRDLTMMYGNPLNDNLTPGAEHLPAGVLPTDKSIVGDHPGDQCAIWIDPIDTDPNYAIEQELAQNCPIERCAHTLTLQNYYDGEFNPDGTFPVISFCDGSPQDQSLTPYADTWVPDGNQYPFEVGLAVDYNGNGIRDELEPIIRQGHEPWGDYGTDGIPDAQEPGYQPGVNDDPNGDDYDPQYNPNGTEGDYRYEAGEPYDDFGLDGVAGTKQQPADGWKKPGDGYDVGEGDGKFTASRGLQRFWDRDAHSIVRKTVDPAKIPAGEMNDGALSRIDLWTDGGLRDIENFAVVGRQLAGAFVGRDRDVSFLTSFSAAPGLDPTQPDQYVPSHTIYEDLQGVVFQRYGHVDPTQQDIDDGSGQHVGTPLEIATRLQSALYFIGSRWPELELRTLAAESGDNPDPSAENCVIVGNCTIQFTSKSGRTGPVGITFPPGYANKDRLGIRYPVIYLLHGYGQKPEDLEAAIIFLRNWMNSPIDSTATRLPKAILVYVDGRCRITNGKAECIRGTFFADSPRKDGAQDEQWWLELMDHVDQTYRTRGESTVDWTE